MAAAGGGAGGGAGGVRLPKGGVSAENVKVAVRCRPFNSREKKLDCKNIVVIEDGTTTKLMDPHAPDKEPHTFHFDHSYFWDSTQDQVWADCGAPILNKAFAGFNGTIFAYGQTGSGKTWSMMGDDEGKQPGITPRLNLELFNILAEKKKADSALEFLVTVSYLEIYNEVIKDLLNPSDKQLNIREHPKLGIYVQDLATLVVDSPAKVRELMDQGMRVRQVAETDMNSRSSRSHTCFTIRIEQRKMEERAAGGGSGDRVTKETKINAKINLVDLAGSERASKTGATGDRLKEGAAINKSLTVLGQVINALAEAGKRHIPYRDSKLTRLLQESLGGNSLTVMVAAISPADDNFEETLSTLRYADRAKQIKNEAKRNEDVSEAIIRELREEIAELQRLLREAAAAKEARAAAGLPEEDEEDERDGAAGGGKRRRRKKGKKTGEGGAGGEDEDEDGDGEDEDEDEEARKVQELEEKIAALEHAKQQTWLEQQRVSQAFEEERQKNLASESRIRSVMATIREDNRELLKRMRTLMEEHTRLTKQFKKVKERHLGHREDLKTLLMRWQELHELDGGVDNGPHAAELEGILTEVETLQRTVETEQEELARLKDDIRQNEEKQEEERLEAAAQRRLLEEDAELRKEIQEEERRKLEKEAHEQLERRVEEERQKLQAKIEQEREELLAKYHGRAGAGGGAGGGGGGGGDAAREQQLELELLNARRDKDLLMIELDRLRGEHVVELRRVRATAARQLRDAKRQELHMFRELSDAFDEERTALETRCRELAVLLQQASEDLRFLTEQNKSLSRQLFEAAAWEPPTL